MSHLVAPSLLSADFSILREEIQMLNNSEADWLHVDVMDGLFVPNITIGPLVVKFLKKYSTKPLDVHLMIVQPERYIKQFAEAGADIISVHYEACIHLQRTISEIKSLGIKAGVALNPHTNVSLLEDVMTDLDMILIMSVNPGFGGQKFIENTYKKLLKLKKLMADMKASPLVEVDGGVDLNNISKLIDHGANVFVAGNTVFSSQNPTETIAKLKQTVNSNKR